MELAGRTLTVDIGRVCAQANGAALIKYGETTVLSTVVASDKPRDGVDFFPLSVEFEEKMYAVGKIPGGFNKREGKASENAILTSRVIDRPMRPLFPKDYRNDVTLNNMVMSVDPECRPEVVGMIGSALVTTMSDIPFDGPCAMTQMGMVDGEFIVNPSQKVWDEGDLQLTVASTRTKVIMIEAGANEIPEAKMIEAIYKCHDVNQTIIEFIDKMVEASQHGVKIDLVVRGICCLIPEIKGYTENIKVISIVGRYLEHSRIYRFGTKEREKIYIASADFMTRNTLRRVEVAVPIYNTDIKMQLIEMFITMLSDNVKAREEDHNGNYKIPKNQDTPLNSQEFFYKQAYLNAENVNS